MLRNKRFLLFLILLLAQVFFSSCKRDKSPLQTDQEYEWVVDSTLVNQMIAQVDSSRIRNTIQTLQDFETRFAYTPQSYEAALWIKEQLESYGYDAEFQSFMTYNLKDVYFLNNQVGWIVGAYGLILKTEDGAKTWQVQNHDPNQEFTGIFFLDDLHGWIWGGTIRGNFLVLYTKDGGQNWSSFINPPLDSQVERIVFNTDQIGWIAVFDRIYKTLDGGNNWIEVFNNNFYKLFDMSVLNDSTVYVSTYRTLQKTEDGGSNWDTVSVGISSINRVIFKNDSLGIILTSEGKIGLTRDCGVSWQIQNLTEKSLTDCIFLSNRKFIIIGKNRYYQSLDAGETWQALQGPKGNLNAIDFKDSNTGIIVGDIVLNRTNDGGITWSKFTEGIAPEIPWNNVIARKKGLQSSAQKIIVGAHYDAIGNTLSSSYLHAPGANDNASGVAGTLEMARIMNQFSFEQTVEFILFDGEEIHPNFRGSKYAADNHIANNEQIFGMINVDMIGYSPDNVYDLGIYSLNFDFRTLFIENVLKYYPLIFYNYDETIADAATYYQAGIPSINISEYTLPTVRDYPWYHSSDDRIDKVNISFTQEAVKFIVSGIAGMAVPMRY